jgi:nucleoside-diphosphate-sugar epimerase
MEYPSSEAMGDAEGRNDGRGGGSRMRVAVTGASGFVGACLVRRLLRDGHEVHLLLRDGHAAWRLEGVLSDVRVHGADIRDAERVRDAVTAARPDWIFHLAVYGAYTWQSDLDRMIATNVAGTANVVDAARRAGVAVLVNVGSSSEYGLKGHAPDEDEALEPNSDYGVTKAAATMLCRLAARREGVRMPTLRLYSAYGPFEEPARLIPTLLIAGMLGRLPRLVRPGVARDFVFVEDAVDALVRAASAEDQPVDGLFNVCTGAQTTIAELVEIVRALLEVREEPRWGSLPDRGWDTHVWVGNPERIRRALDWEARTPVEEGLRRTLEWLTARPERLASYRRSVLAREPSLG